MAHRQAVIRRVARAAAPAVAVGVLCLALAGCSSLSIFLADNIPQWAGGLPKDAPPRPTDPRYAEYFKTQLAIQKSIQDRRLAEGPAREQDARIERAQIAGGHVERAQSARRLMAQEPRAEDTSVVDNFPTTGRPLY